MCLGPPEWGRTGFGASAQCFIKENTVTLTTNTPFPNNYPIGDPLFMWDSNM